MIKYTIVCPNCGKTKTFEKKCPSHYERKFCNRSCANSYTSKQKWADPEFRQTAIASMTAKWAEPEHKQKMIVAANSPERNTKLRASLEIYWSESEHHEAASQRMKDVWGINSEYRKTVSMHNKERWEDPEYREMMVEVQTIAANKPERIQQLSEITTELWRKPKFRQTVLSAIQQAKDTPEHSQKMSKAQLKKWADPEYHERMCRIRQELWAEPEWAIQQIQKMRAGWNTKPTKPELELFDLLNENGYKYDYVGDNSLYFGTKNPDFVWVEQNLIVECFGGYWHDGDEIEPRIEHFRNYGFDTLIIWDYELDDTEQLLIKLKDFHSRHEID